MVHEIQFKHLGKSKANEVYWVSCAAQDYFLA